MTNSLFPFWFNLTPTVNLAKNKYQKINVSCLKQLNKERKNITYNINLVSIEKQKLNK